MAQRAIGSSSSDSEPVAPGIPANIAKDVLVFEYGTQESLDAIRDLGHELAAVLVEPVQSRRLDLQPVSFLRDLRAVTESTGTALIFDEMITGFRAHPAGCQGLFGIDADLATYGKIIGGGLPVGAVAGSARFMNGIDGGTWRFGDQSYPSAARTYFGGTFCQHPLTMAGSLAVLRHLKAEGPALQENLTKRTAEFAETLNSFFVAEGLSIRVSYFASMFRFEFSGNLEMLFYHLLDKGVYIWEWRNCFLSTAHSDEDLERVIRAVKESVAELRGAGLLALRENTSGLKSQSALTPRVENGKPCCEVKLGPANDQAERPVDPSGFWNRGKSKLGQRTNTAGELGVGVLTNLMGQTLDELTDNIASYRAALAEHGHGPDAGTVTILLHTYVREDAEQAIREARRPLCDYLLSSMTLFKRLAQSQGLAIDLDGLSDTDREYIVQTAYDKYVASSALIGSPDSCRPIVESLIDAGVDEIACFVDFGVPTDLALQGLPQLNELRKRWASGSSKTISYPMSEAQQQLWLLAKLSDDGAKAYNDPAVLTIDGPIDLNAFTKALNQVVERHESLRTTVDPHGERLVVQPHTPIAPQLIDLASSNNPGEAVRAHLEQLNRTLIDFVNGPIFSVTLLKVAEQRHVLVLASHHLVTDGLSMLNVLNELNTCYIAQQRGASPSLASPLQFREFVRWHEEQKSTPAMAEHEAFWMRQFEVPVPPLEWPTDRPRPAVKTFNGAVRRLEIDKSLTDRAAKLAESSGVTQFMLLLAVYEVLLHRLSGQERIVVGCPSAGRGMEGGNSLVGYCAHLLPVVSYVSKSNTGGLHFDEHLRHVRGALLDAYQHQDYPFARLVNKLDLKRDISRSPLLSTVFNFERPTYETHDDGLQIAIHERHVSFARMELTLTANLFDSGIVLECDYNTDLFDAATIDRMLSHYKTLLASVVEHPQCDVHLLPVLDEPKRQQQLRTWNESEPHNVDRCFQQLFEARVDQHPNAVAVCERSSGVQLSYRELNERANQLAHFLRRAGVGPEQRVGVCIDRSVDLMAAILGTLKAGAAYVPMDPAYPARILGRSLAQHRSLFRGARMFAERIDTATIGSRPGPDIDRNGSAKPIEYTATVLYQPSAREPIA